MDAQGKLVRYGLIFIILAVIAAWSLQAEFAPTINSASTVNQYACEHGATYTILQAGAYTDALSAKHCVIAYGGPNNAGGVSGSNAHSVFEAAISTSRGGEVFVRNGTYSISQSIDAQVSNVNLIGESWGADLVAGPALTDPTGLCGYSAIVCIKGVSGWTISNLQFDGNAPAQGNCSSQCGNDLEIDYSTHMTVEDNYLHSAKSDGLHFYKDSYSWVLDNYLANDRVNGIFLNNNPSPYNGLGYWNVVRANDVNGSSDVGISDSEINDIITQNLVDNITSSNGDANSHIGILLGDVGNDTGTIVSDNTLYNIPYTCIALGTSQVAYRPTVDGNQLYDCGNGIDTQADSPIISNNQITSTTGTAGACTSGYGIMTSSGSTDTTLSFNTVNDTTGTGICLNGGTATVTGGSVTLTQHMGLSEYDGIDDFANNQTITGVIVDATAITSSTSYIVGIDVYYSNVKVIGNTILGIKTYDLAGLELGGMNDLAANNQIGGFSYCLFISGATNAQASSNILSQSTCSTVIYNSPNSSLIVNNIGYNPIGTKTNFLLTGGTGSGDGNWVSPFGRSASWSTAPTYTITIATACILIQTANGATISINGGSAVSINTGELFCEPPGTTIKWTGGTPTTQVSFW